MAVLVHKRPSLLRITPCNTLRVNAPYAIQFTKFLPQNWHYLPTQKNKRHWAVKIDTARLNPPLPLLLVFVAVVVGLQVPFFRSSNQ